MPSPPPRPLAGTRSRLVAALAVLGAVGLPGLLGCDGGEASPGLGPTPLAPAPSSPAERADLRLAGAPGTADAPPRAPAPAATRADGAARPTPPLPADPRPVHGRVVHLRSGHGIPDYPVWVTGPDGAVHARTTDATGAFALDAPLPAGPAHVRVRNRAEHPVRGSRTTRTLTHDEALGRVPVLVEVARHWVGAVHGRVVDERTGQPVPGQALTLRAFPDLPERSSRTLAQWGGEGTHRVETDGSGRFHLEGLRGGWYEVLGTRFVEAVGGPLDLVVDAGRDVELRVVRGDEVRVRVTGAGPADALAVEFQRPNGTRTAVELLTREEDGTLRVRLPLREAADADGPGALVVRDATGPLAGVSGPLVPHGPGVWTTGVVLTPRGHVVWTVNGEPRNVHPAFGEVPRLRPVGEPLPRLGAHDLLSWTDLPPGAYEFRYEALGRVTESRVVEVVGGRTTEVECTPRWLPGWDAIRLIEARQAEELEELLDGDG